MNVPKLSLDIAMITGCTPGNTVDRRDVVFFLECKSVNHAPPELVATVLGQSFFSEEGVGKASLCKD